ncbi:MAG: hypothetical protein MUF86_09030, partial [Akkermansiaceae bacterium]|nr:hypothetical protein [Akkermansiaceae bacterium]
MAGEIAQRSHAPQATQPAIQGGKRISDKFHGVFFRCDSSTRTLIVRKGKNGKSRMLPVGERAAAWLDRFL